MNRARAWMAFLIFASIRLAMAAEGPSPGEDLFKWGEYDSLIRLLEPSTMNPRPVTGADSLVRAKSYLFLGVAFFATGKPDQADSAFKTACSLDPKVQLDRFYVTEEIANHFQAIAIDGIRRRQAKSAMAATTAAMSAKTDAQQGRAPTASIRRDEKGWVWWGLGATALVTAGGGAYFFINRDASQSDNVTTIDMRK
jgi:hypothetical protein